MSDHSAENDVPVRVHSLPHHVVLKNGRDDIVCTCGEHFQRSTVPSDLGGLDAIQQWVKHYRDRVTPPEKGEL